MVKPGVFSFEIPDLYRTTRNERKGTFVNPWQASLKRANLSKFFKTRLDKTLNYPVGKPLPTLPFTEERCNAFMNSKLAVWWLGHSSCLCNLNGRLILTDPILGNAGVGPLGMVRKAPAPITAWSELPGVDTVLCSHNHFDHLSVDSMRDIEKAFHPTFVCGTGVEPLLTKAGVPEERIHACSWWDRADIGGMTVTFVPAQHWSRRGVHDRNQTLWGGFVAELDGKRLFYPGDTGYNKGLFQTIAQLGPMDLSLLPIGCGHPEAVAGYQHVHSEGALRIHDDVGSRCSLAIHHGTYPTGLATESLQSPGAEMAGLAGQRGKGDVHVGQVGMVVMAEE
ncbi:N-acyl-phosphatidylethanolamine-hydrolyzing phospholipase D [Carpediemonas membranifera]|uniref:N-acyl-phosphatidylethanolamine-hydrolyzing phospholipase D n=1 Tax=Carpediemonas membranifera TaxID=201153 RepID=A0A8J6E9A9_9EUKA|nr:N-acyl-phosphatidylethanolamine-hydrolyzing phospholipase D [Carpediemonas membranifera]|eukprot:KAG9393070.1 N-acyl-phosphatidylethanolamine-hydrolyzing phospholipase D [Carpediemonas membranifera]